jgi:hypothetical protein
MSHLQEKEPTLKLKESCETHPFDCSQVLYLLLKLRTQVAFLHFTTRVISLQQIVLCSSLRKADYKDHMNGEILWQFWTITAG